MHLKEARDFSRVRLHLEEDAVAYAADRTAYLEENEPGKGICFQYGCIVVFGTANILNEIKPAN
ncbi:MAG: hypothetical protein IJQ93_04660 [Bacteroidales bacterium]|nr:hypothetical protein [Bacteroidales bacterium]